jgi:hypothetical protein
MAFKLNLTGKFTRKNIVIELMNERGVWEKSTLDATYLQPTTDELDELRDLKPKEVLERNLTGVAGLLDDDGNSIELTPEHKVALLEIPAAVLALSRAFWEGVVRSPKA